MSNTTHSLTDLSFGDTISSEDIIKARDYLAALIEPTPEESADLDALHAIVQEGEDTISDWRDGATLIRESYFKDYAQELADDCASSAEVQEAMNHWPHNCIDWEKAAGELKFDYSEIKIGGTTFLGCSA